MSTHQVLYDLFTTGHDGQDPGDAGTFQVDRWGLSFALVSGASGQTRTLGVPTKSGLQVGFSFVTDGGGDITLTVTSGFDQAGNTALTFANVGEAIVLHSVETLLSSGTPTFRWRVLANNGVAGPTTANDVALTDEVDLTFGAPDVTMRWDTSDADSNEFLLQLPTGTAVNVPVVVIGQGIVDVDLGLYNGVTEPRVALLSSGAVTTGPVLEMRKARGTTASPTVVTSGDDIGHIDFYGAVAAGEYVRGASIQADMAGTIATTRGPGTLTFKTATDAAPSVLTTALTIGADQICTFAAGVTLTTTAPLTMGEGGNVVVGTSTGTKIGTSTTQKLGFFNSAPIVQPTGIVQTYATADPTLANDTASDMATTASTQTTPWGFASQAQADAIATKFNALRVDVDDCKQFVNSVVDKLQALGLLA